MENTNDILEELKLRADMLDQAEQEMELEPSEKESLFFVRVIAHIRGLMQQDETDRDFIQQYQQQVGAMKVERDKLIQAVADHLTVRAEQRQRIQELEELNDKRLGEIQTTLRLLAEARREAAECRNREELIRNNLQFERELHEATRKEAAEAQALVADAANRLCGHDWLPRSVRRLQSELRRANQSTLAAAIEEAIAPYRDLLAYARTVIQSDWEDAQGGNQPMREWCDKVDAIDKARGEK